MEVNEEIVKDKEKSPPSHTLRDDSGDFVKEHEPQIRGLALLQTLCYHYSYGKLCRICDLDPVSSKSYLNRILRGKQKPSQGVKDALSKFFNVKESLLFQENKE